MSGRNVFVTLPGTLDPIARAKLSPAQTALMEPLACVVNGLTDANGLRIMFHMDFWIMAQLISKLFNADGTAKFPEEIIYGAMS